MILWIVAKGKNFTLEYFFFTCNNIGSLNKMVLIKGRSTKCFLATWYYS